MTLESVILQCRQQAEVQSMSLALLAQKIGVSRGQISNWFNGRRTPSASHLWALINAVHLQVKLEGAESNHQLNAKNPVLIESKTTNRVKASKVTRRIDPIRQAPAFDNLSSAEIESARHLFGLDLSHGR